MNTCHPAALQTLQAEPTAKDTGWPWLECLFQRTCEELRKHSRRNAHRHPEAALAALSAIAL